jgi:hypothetical protein
MMHATLALGLLWVAVPPDPRVVAPVAIVGDRTELRRKLNGAGVKFDELFVATVADGEAARQALRPYLESAIAREREPYRKSQLRGILAQSALYDWHCGGFSWHGQRSLFCTFDRGEVARARGKFPPEAMDGGISWCRCLFRLREQRIEQLEWHGEA